MIRSCLCPEGKHKAGVGAMEDVSLLRQTVPAEYLARPDERPDYIDWPPLRIEHEANVGDCIVVCSLIAGDLSTPRRPAIAGVMVLSAVILPGCGMAPHDDAQRLGVSM